MADLPFVYMLAVFFGLYVAPMLVYQAWPEIEDAARGWRR